MSIYISTKVKPYVYICVHHRTKQFYIGYRETNTKPSDTDLPLYRTSSKKVRKIFNEFTWYIVAEFNFGIDAYDFEQQLIFEHWGDPLLLNQNCHYGKRRFKSTKGKPGKKGVTPWNKGLIGSQVVSNETKQKHRENKSETFTMKGKYHSLETKKKMSISKLGKSKPGLSGEKNGFYGRTHTEEVRAQLSTMNKGKIDSYETKLRKAESARKRWAKIKELSSNKADELLSKTR